MKRFILLLLLACSIVTLPACNRQSVTDEDQEATPTPTSSYVIPLDQLPQEYTSEMAIANGDYVDMHGTISNETAMDAFLQKFYDKEDAFLRKVQFTVEGDPIITDFSFQDLEFTVKTDSTRDQFGPQEITEAVYKYLVIYIDETGQYYIVTNHEEITEEIFRSSDYGILLKYVPKE
jgi:hypothetical protein